MKKCPVCKNIFSNKSFRKHFESCALSEESSGSEANVQTTLNKETNVDNVPPMVDVTDTPYTFQSEAADIRTDECGFDFPVEEDLEDLDEEILEMISQHYFENTSSGEEADEAMEENNDENLEHDHEPINRTISISSWICLFLALWQFHYNITDSAFECLLKFVHGLLAILVQHFGLDSAILIGLPSSLYLFHKCVNTTERFKKYVVCIKCHTLYEFEKSVTRIQGQQVSKRCSHIEFPNHNLPHLRKQCGQELMETVRIGNSTSLVPYKTYCYKPLLTTLKYLFKRKNFFQLCTSWLTRKVHPEILSDVYDGQLWKDFSDPNKMDFLNHAGNIGIMLNCDWFCPYKKVRTYSIGALYSVVMNLPRSIR